MQASMTPTELRDALARGESFTIIDVRGPDEFVDWHIPGATNVPVHDIVAGATPKATSGPLVTICAHGARSQRAADALARRGHAVRFVAGGMVEWNSTYRAIEIPSGAARVLQIQRLGKSCLSYLLVSGQEALVIDPSADIEEYVRLAASASARIVRVADTHAHADHVSGAERLAKQTGATYLAPHELGERVKHQTIRAGEEIRVGDATLRVIETPGHTPGSLSFLLADLAFTGDTLFADSVGRPDLGQDPRPNAAVLFASLHERLMPLPPQTRILPAHAKQLLDPRDSQPIAASLGELVKGLEALRMNQHQFVEWVAGNTLPKPENFGHIKRINRGEEGMPDLEDIHELEAGPNRCAVQ